MQLAISRNNGGWRSGESHHRAVLTDHEVELIRQLRDEGITLGVLAVKFGVSKSQVWAIVNYVQR